MPPNPKPREDFPFPPAATLELLESVFPLKVGRPPLDLGLEPWENDLEAGEEYIVPEFYGLGRE